MDRLDAMQVFVCVAELGSFAAAAQRLGVARSAVTRQIASLEQRLGVKLIARSTRRLSLTAAGATFLEKCRVILTLVETAESDVAQERQTPRGAIRATVPLSYGLKRLTPHLLAFAREYPEVTLALDYSDRRSNLIEEGIDLAIRVTGRLDPGEVTRRIGSESMMTVAAPDYVARHGEPAHPADLIHHECLAYASDAPQNWLYEIDGHPTRVPIRARITANNGDVLVEAAASGLGIARQPAFIAAPLVGSGRLREILPDFRSTPLGVYVVLPGNRYIPHRVRVLIDWLAARLSDAAPAAD